MQDDGSAWKDRIRWCILSEMRPSANPLNSLSTSFQSNERVKNMISTYSIPGGMQVYRYSGDDSNKP